MKIARDYLNIAVTIWHKYCHASVVALDETFIVGLAVTVGLISVI